MGKCQEDHISSTSIIKFIFQSWGLHKAFDKDELLPFEKLYMTNCMLKLKTFYKNHLRENPINTLWDWNFIITCTLFVIHCKYWQRFYVFSCSLFRWMKCLRPSDTLKKTIENKLVSIFELSPIFKYFAHFSSRVVSLHINNNVKVKKIKSCD